MSLIGLVLAIVVFGVIVWAARSLLSAFGIGDPVATVVQVLIVLAFLFWLLQAFGFTAPLVRLR